MDTYLSEHFAGTDCDSSLGPENRQQKTAKDDAEVNALPGRVLQALHDDRMRTLAEAARLAKRQRSIRVRVASVLERRLPDRITDGLKDTLEKLPHATANESEAYAKSQTACHRGDA
jgi:hypothetical protein